MEINWGKWQNAFFLPVWRVSYLLGTLRGRLTKTQIQIGWVCERKMVPSDDSASPMIQKQPRREREGSRDKI